VPTLIGTLLSNVDLTSVVIDENTNFTAAKMQNVILTNRSLVGVTFTHTDLTGSKLDGTNLTNGEMSYANLTNANLSNGVKMYGASLSNATLTGANFTGAQLGAKQAAGSFTLDHSLQPDLDSGTITTAIQNVFQTNNHQLSQVAVLNVQVPGSQWSIRDKHALYQIASNSNSLLVNVYTTDSQAAVLAGAYMPNAVFTDANLYAVDMAGVNWYGTSAKADNTDMELANLSNANLSNMDFSQSRLYGCSFDFSYLIQTDFRGAFLTAALSNKPVSMVGANLQGANFTQAQLSAAVLTNAAVSLNEGPFFTLPSSYSTDLDNLQISSDLSAQFSKKTYPLDSKATVTANLLGTSWTITNGATTSYPQYNIQKIGQTLFVSGGPVGVHLFNITKDMIPDLDAQNVSSTLQNAFSANGYALVDNALIDQVIISGQKWHLKNEINDSTTLQKGYVDFYLIQERDAIHVYGSMLSVVRQSDNQTLEQVPFSLPSTLLTQDVMDLSTTCPNGQRLRTYLNLGTSNLLTWEQMMTANTPPVPPACIPSNDHWC